MSLSIGTMMMFMAVTRLPLGILPLASMIHLPSSHHSDSPKVPVLSKIQARKPVAGSLPMMCEPVWSVLPFRVNV